MTASRSPMPSCSGSSRPPDGPSTYNEQEWRFLYAHRDTPHWPDFFGLLMEANQAWCHRAAV